MAEMRLIDANALKEKAIRVSTVKENTYLKAVGTHEIDKAPTIDAVSVVRCKDCVHWFGRDGDPVCLKIYEDGAVSSYAWQTREPEDFCSYGKRKEAFGDGT